MAIIGGLTEEDVRARLGSWLADRFDGAKIADVSQPTGNGRSTDTFLVDLDRGPGVVVRVEPGAFRVVYEYDLAREARVMNAVAEHTDVPAPRVLHHEPDPELLGSPFLILERLHGRTPGDEPPFPADPSSWVHTLTDDQRAAMFDDALRRVAQIHAADWRVLGLADLVRPRLGDDPLAQHVGWWREFYAWGSAGRPCRTIEQAFEWLDAHWPADPGPTVLTWGDSRLGNIMFEGGAVSAVLDWELATLAPAGVDLGWWLFSDRHHSAGIGAPWPTGFPDRAGTLTGYARRSGFEIPHDEWFEVYGGLRFAALMNRAGNMLVDAGALPAEDTMAVNNPATHLLAGLIGVEAPEGTATSFLNSGG
ncbi:MAG TPA: phosphotransferase family protein [Trebonia sp.]|nr:phosphotransferase family protein [Trebonia sp.]